MIKQLFLELVNMRENYCNITESNLRTNLHLVLTELNISIIGEIYWDAHFMTNLIISQRYVMVIGGQEDDSTFSICWGLVLEPQALCVADL